MENLNSTGLAVAAKNAVTAIRASWEVLFLTRLVERFMLSTEAARRLQISRSYVRFLTDTGKLPAVRTVEGVRLLREADIERLRKERRRQTERLSD